MKSLRNYVYAAVMTASALNLAPSLAAAQEPARGKFTLTHEVRWGSGKLPAGEYSFSYDPNSSSHMLSVIGDRTGLLVLVSETDETKAADTSKLILESTPEGSYVSIMQLPEFGMTLHFVVPSHPTVSKIARAGTTGLAAGQ